MIKMTTEERILAFFKAKGNDISVDTDLFKGGYVNSLFALEVVMYLEKEFKIKIKNKDITEKNFKTVAQIAKTVENYL